MIQLEIFHILHLHDGSYHSKMQEIVGWVVEEVVTIQEAFQDIYDTHGHQFPIDFVVHMESPKTRENVFILKFHEILEFQIAHGTRNELQDLSNVAIKEWTIALVPPQVLSGTILIVDMFFILSIDFIHFLCKDGFMNFNGVDMGWLLSGFEFMFFILNDIVLVIVVWSLPLLIILLFNDLFILVGLLFDLLWFIVNEMFWVAIDIILFNIYPNELIHI